MRLVCSFCSGMFEQSYIDNGKFSFTSFFDGGGFIVVVLLFSRVVSCCRGNVGPVAPIDEVAG